MTRFMLFTIVLLSCVFLGILAGAEDKPKKLTLEERKELEAKSKALNAAGSKAYREGKIDDAVKAFAEELQIDRRLYPKDEYPDGHANLATILNNLAYLYQAQGKLMHAEPLYQEALDMYKQQFKGDHPNIATSINNLAYLYQAQGKLVDAEGSPLDS